MPEYPAFKFRLRKNILSAVLIFIFAASAVLFAAPRWDYAGGLAGLVLFSAWLVLRNTKIFLLAVLLLWVFWSALGESVTLNLHADFSFNIKGFLNALLIYSGLLYALRGKFPVDSSRPFCFYGAFLILSALSLLYSEGLSYGVRFLARIAAPFCFFLIIHGETTQKKKVSFLPAAILASSVVPLSVGLYQVFSGTGFPDPVGIVRLNSIFPHPLPFSYYLVMLLFVILFYLFRISFFYLRIVFFVLGAAAAFLLLLTYSRAAWIAGAFAMAYFAWFHRGKWKISLAFCASVLLMALLITPVRERAFSVFWQAGRDSVGALPHEESILWRQGARGVLFDDISGFALLKGRGAGSSVAAIERGMGKPDSPHNDYIMVLYENGVPGLVLFLSFVMFLLTRSAGAAKRAKGSSGADYAALSTAAAIMFVVIAAADGFLEQTSVSVYYWTLFAFSEIPRGEES